MSDSGHETPHADPALEIARLRRALGASRDLLTQRSGQTQHRIRNLLSVIRAINSRSFERAVSLEDLAMHQSGRISALARVEEALDLNDGVYADLEQMIREEWFVVVSASEEGRVHAEGPRAGLAPKAAERVGLALHELTTNALKFGALSTPAGTIHVGWTLAAGRLDITWTESGVPLINMSPSRTGFGRDLIEQGLPYDLLAETSLAFVPGGARCVISLPIEANVVLELRRGGSSGA